MEDLNRVNVLLVEDDPDAMAVLHETMQSISGLNLTYSLASSGNEALAVVKAKTIDVIVADIVMPEMSGLELLQALGTCGYYQPFIFVTSMQSRDTAVEALRLGAFDFIDKPISLSKLEHPLRKAVRVSAAYGALETATDQARSTQLGLHKAAQEILKLRAMRFQSGAKS